MFNILVVDDTPDSLEQLKWAASNGGREVFLASSAKDAIDLIKMHNFDVIITDLRMETPLAGFDVVLAAVDKDIYTQVIVITAYGSPDVSVKALRLGAFDFLERSTPGLNTLEMLKHKISLALNFRRMMVEREKNNGTKDGS